MCGLFVQKHRSPQTVRKSREGGHRLDSLQAVELGIFVVLALVRIHELASVHADLAKRLNELEQKTEGLAMSHDTVNRESALDQGTHWCGQPAHDAVESAQAADWVHQPRGQQQEDLVELGNTKTQEVGAEPMFEVRRARTTIWPTTK